MWWLWAAFPLFAFLHPAVAQAGSGGLDPAFGEGGLVSTPLDTARRSSVELGVGLDGSAVVGTPSGYLVRFGADGSPDSTFGDGGRLGLGPDPLSPGDEQDSFHPSNFVVDGTGRVLIFGGESNARRGYQVANSSSTTGELLTAPESQAVVLRFTDEGQRDTAFGSGTGFVRSSFGLRAQFPTHIPLIDVLAGRVDSKQRPVFVAGAAAVALGCNAGGLTSYPRAVVRLTEAGKIDRTFSGNGVAPIAGSTDSPVLGIDAADRPGIRVGPYPRPRLDCRPGITLVRLGAGGAPLRRFGDGGSRTFGQLLHLAFVSPSGAMILTRIDGRTLEVVRLGLSGRRDRRFGRNGTARVRLPIPTGAHIKPVGVDARDRIVLAGFLGSRDPYPPPGVPKHPSLAVARLSPGGRLDASLGKHGWIVDPISKPVEVGSTAASLDSQGRLLLAATITAPNQTEGGYLLARYLLGP
jgi:hypothetical protein